MFTNVNLKMFTFVTQLESMKSLQLATTYFEPRLKGKYIHLKTIPILDSLKSIFIINEIGKSVQNNSIYQVKIGTGATTILIWSQMHGNEPTTTKGLFDFFNFLAGDDEIAQQIKSKFTLVCIPILNPDGAFNYMRVNANGVDLNRDAFNASQPEMQILHRVYKEISPDFCYNLHDQRSLFGTEGFNLPATISFLAPAYNEERAFNEVRLKAIHIINRMHVALQSYIPNQIGRFDDSYNVNCTGDYFTTLNTPTILFEAGHFKDDYERDQSRKYIFIALLSSLQVPNENVIVDNDLIKYLNIPQNNKRFFDFIYKNVKIIDNSVEKIINFAAQYEEVLEGNEVFFKAKISKVSDLEDFFGHIEYDCENMLFSSNGMNKPEIGGKADFSLDNLTFFNNGVKII